MTLGEPRIHVESCESTQALLDPSMPEGAVAVADFQTAGRGRLGRTWEAPPGSALLASVLLKPPAGPAAAAARARRRHRRGRRARAADRPRGPDQVAERRDAPPDRRSAGSSPRPATAWSSSGSASTSTRRTAELPERGGSLRTTTGQEWERDDVLDAVLADARRPLRGVARRRARRGLRGPRPARLPPRPPGDGGRHDRRRRADRPRGQAPDRRRPRRVGHGRERRSPVRPLIRAQPSVSGISTWWVLEPSAAEHLEDDQLPGPFGASKRIVTSNVPRVPEPDVAVTKWCESTFPAGSSSSYSKFASNVFAVPQTRSGDATVANGSGASTRIAGVSSSKSERRVALPVDVDRLRGVELREREDLLRRPFGRLALREPDRALCVGRPGGDRGEQRRAVDGHELASDRPDLPVAHEVDAYRLRARRRRRHGLRDRLRRGHGDRLRRPTARGDDRDAERATRACAFAAQRTRASSLESRDGRPDHHGIEVEGLVREFKDVRAVDGIDLVVAPGEIYGFLGPNGAGKSTTVHMLTTLLPPTAGRATVAGFDVVKQGPHVRRSDRRRAPGGGARPAAHRPRPHAPADRAARHPARRAGGPRRRAARARRPDRAPPTAASRTLLRRDEAPPRPGARARPPPAASCSSTSRPPVSTRRAATRSGARSAASRRRRA